MSKRKSSPDSRNAILDAAQQVVAREGAANLTLDAVAKESGFSKGGLLYNFPSKEALIQGMLQRLIDSVEPKMQAFRDEVASELNPTLQAMIECVRCEEIIDRNISMAILAAGAQNPQLLDPLRNLYKEHYQSIQQESPDPDLAMLLWAAADGLMFMSLLNIEPFPADKADHLMDRLLQLAKDEQINTPCNEQPVS
ncbi:TetR/AcrR family transcriptional regulator [Nitrincola sp. MINF-07-Sa-05]|uniref:TetR/AcrR family transcriptional regulator n=1 Tax=Nitrincola salilacus TaxID=3400273 RepID=UPI0039180011